MKNYSYTIKKGEHKGKTLWSGRYTCVASFIFCVYKGDMYVLANKRGIGTPNEQGKWNCPCGFLEGDEYGNEGAAREVYEETGLKINLTDKENLFKVDTKPSKSGNVTLLYTQTLIKQELPKLKITNLGEENEVDEVKWIKLSDIDLYEWAFNHKSIIKHLKDLNINNKYLLP